MRAAASGAGARARVRASVWETVYLGVHAQKRPSRLRPQTHALPPSLLLSLSARRIYFDLSLPPRCKSVNQPGSARLKRGRPLRARRILCAASIRGGGAGCRAVRGGACDDEQGAALGACRACKEERDGRLFLPRSCRLSLPDIRSANDAEARANALDLADGSEAQANALDLADGSS
jgi:hypothetical protein